MAHIKMLKEQPETQEESVESLIELYDELMGVQDRRGFWNPAPDCTHVHIVIGDSFAGSMKLALKELGWSDTHKMIILRENYAMGPLRQLDSLQGRSARSEWFCDHITEALEYYTEFEEEYQELLHNIERIPGQARIVMWADDNACEQAGMRHAASLLRHRSNPIALYNACSMCEELYNRPDARIDYLCSGEIPSHKLKEVLTRMDENNRLSPDDIARLAQEWQDISERSGMLRIWRDGAVTEVTADYYDSYLLEKLDQLKPPTGDQGFMKSARLIGEAIGHCEQYIGDAYFEYRLRELIYAGVLEIKGVPAAMRYYSVRRKR
ncbi:hypothetical protein DCC85_02820 [Paenibacillus sp. CAA11]|nr:hypothetical protein DCC85_02820 [Paenibacillus sp. CAA11]